MKRVLSVLVATILALTGVTSAAHAATGDVTAEIIVHHWNGGYGADVVVSNHGDAATTSWTVQFDLPAGTAITRYWSAQLIQDGGHYTFTNATFNGDIAPGGSEDFGFNASGDAEPTGCTVDGAPCDNASGVDTQAPGAPTGLTATGVTAGSVTLTWDAATDDVGVIGYDVLQGGAAVVRTAGTSATVTGLAPDTFYTFAVAARHAAGNASDPSAALTVSTLAAGGDGAVVDVSTGPELAAALANAEPGQTIRLASGEYHGSFVAERPGAAADPITLTGPSDAVLVNDGPSGSGPSCPAPGGDFDPGYGLWLFAAPYWNLRGFAIADSMKGLVIDASPHVTVDGLYVHDIDQEGVHFRRSSADGVVRDSRIERTGLVDPGFGEGIYVGSAQSNFACYAGPDGVDSSDRVQILGNHIGPYVGAEALDLKEGTEGGVVSGNTFDGTGISGENFADSWVDVKGNDYRFEDNTATVGEGGGIVRGYAALNLLDGYGCGNEWIGNASDLGGAGEYAIWIQGSNSACPDDPNIVHASNTVTGATKGLTNIALTP